eukprot:293756-Hanusia_phi.AAC.1
MTTGLWRAEYCSTCAAQQKEDGIVCVKVVDGSSRAFTDLHLQHGARLEVNVYNDSSDEFIDLHGRCGVCYRQATHGVEMPGLKELALNAISLTCLIASMQTRMSMESCCNMV